MIRRSLRARFHQIGWEPFAPESLPSGPLILYANHHTWFDGYLMYALVTQLKVRCVDWITEFHAFPLFARVGGMPFPAEDPAVRSRTIRSTLRLMRDEGRSLVIFPEGVLHPGPEVMPFGRALALIQRQVPHAHLVPVAIHTTFDLHERPEAWLRLGEPIRASSCDDPRDALVKLGQGLVVSVRDNPAEFCGLSPGTLDVNERWGRARKR